MVTTIHFEQDKFYIRHVLIHKKYES
ncbi:MAG: type II toxin-antitoxin system HigB family toxin [Glaciimonas sp.]|nr:type II toxin-antitoxin system HigB family toxin [Glaciimonas sp.]